MSLEQLVPEDVYNFYAIVGSDVPLDNFKDFFIELKEKLWKNLRAAIAYRVSTVIIPLIEDIDDLGGFLSKDSFMRAGGLEEIWQKAFTLYQSKSNTPLIKNGETYDVFDIYLTKEERRSFTEIMNKKEINSLFQVLKHKGPLETISASGSWQKLWNLLKKYEEYDDDNKIIIAIDTILNASHHNGPIISWLTSEENFNDLIMALNLKSKSKNLSDIFSRTDSNFRIRINKERHHCGKKLIMVNIIEESDVEESSLLLENNEEPEHHTKRFDSMF